MLGGDQADKMDYLQGYSFEFGFHQSTRSKHVVEGKCLLLLDNRNMIPHNAPRCIQLDLQVLVSSLLLLSCLRVQALETQRQALKVWIWRVSTRSREHIVSCQLCQRGWHYSLNTARISQFLLVIGNDRILPCLHFPGVSLNTSR